MNKLAYVFTNGLTSELVILFKNEVDEIDTETLNERVLNEVLLPNDWSRFCSTSEELEKHDWEKDEEGYFVDMVSVYGNDNKEYFFFEDNLLIKYANEEDLKAWKSLYWTTIIELD